MKSTDMSAPDYLTTHQASKRMGVSSDTVRRYCKQQILSGAKKGPDKNWLIPKNAVDAWIAENPRVKKKFEDQSNSVRNNELDGGVPTAISQHKQVGGFDNNASSSNVPEPKEANLGIAWLRSHPIIAYLSVATAIIAFLAGIFGIYSDSGLRDNLKDYLATSTPTLTPTLYASPTLVPTPSHTPTSTPVPTPESVADGEYLILVAQFEPLEEPFRDVARFIVDDLQRNVEDSLLFPGIKVRLFQDVITSKAKAESVALEYGALLVIWGNYNASIVEVEVQLGDTNAFPFTRNFNRESLEETINVQTRMANEREQSLVAFVLAPFIILEFAEGDAHEGARIFAMLDSIDFVSAEVRSQSVGGHVHKFVELYLTDTERALDEINAALTLNARNDYPLLYILRSLVYQRLTRYDPALVDADTAIRLGPDGWATPLLIKNIHSFYVEQDLNASLDYLNEIIKYRPNDWYPIHFRGAIYYLQREFELAKVDLELALGLGAQTNWPYALFAAIALREGRVTEVSDIITIVLRDFPDPAFELSINEVFYGESLPNDIFRPLISTFGSLVLGRFEDAVEKSEIALAIDEKHLLADTTYLAQGLAYCNLSRFSDAELAYSNALEIAPEFTVLYLLRAEVRAKLGNFPGALDDLNIAEGNPALQTLLDNASSNELISLFGCQSLFSLSP